jgi:hypothetical protein
MARLSSRIEAVLAQLAPEIGPVQFWTLFGDGLARCGDLVIPEPEFMEQYGVAKGVLSYGSATESRQRTP